MVEFGLYKRLTFQLIDWSGWKKTAVNGIKYLRNPHRNVDWCCVSECKLVTDHERGGSWGANAGRA